MKIEYRSLSNQTTTLNESSFVNNIHFLKSKISKFRTEYQVFRKDNYNFSKLIFDILQKRKWNRAIFKDRTLLDDSTYTRIMKMDDRKWKFETIIAICVGLKLPLKTTETLLEVSGYSFGVSEDYQIYKFLFTEFRGWSIDECNIFLKSMGLSLLGSN